MPIHEYKCRKCGAVSEYLEEQGEWHLLPRKCRQCGRRKTTRIVSRFSASVKRSRTETLNELKRMGNVNFVPGKPPAWGRGPPPGGCPYENAARKGNREDRPHEERPIKAKQGS